MTRLDQRTRNWTDMKMSLTFSEHLVSEKFKSSIHDKNHAGQQSDC